MSFCIEMLFVYFVMEIFMKKRLSFEQKGVRLELVQVDFIKLAFCWINKSVLQVKAFSSVSNLIIWSSTCLR